MARGGYRPGAGRPKKTDAAPPSDVKREAKAVGQSPLEYMLGVMNDETVDGPRRDRMAIAAAPFVHARAEAVEPGKKAQRQASAEQVASAGRFAPRAGPRLAVNNS